MKQELNTVDATGKTPLMLAAWKGDLEEFNRLLNKGADPLLCDKAGNSLLHYAARQANLTVLMAALKSNPDIDLQNRSDKQTPLFTPSEVGRAANVEALLAYGANPNLLDKAKFTALHWAAQNGHTDCIRLLLKYKAQVNTSSTKKLTPLMSACIEGSVVNVQMLLAAGAKVNAQDKDGYTPLMFAAYYEWFDIVEYLLTQQADAHIQDIKGNTALMIATQKNQEAVRLLLTA